MLIGDERISSGEAFVQFDAFLEDLTGSETIEIFALLRGVRSSDISNLKSHFARKLNFQQLLKKKIREYSGGNKRKLSSAIALIGNPIVIYLGKFWAFISFY